MLASEGLQKLKAKAALEAPQRKTKRTRATKRAVWLFVLYALFVFGAREHKLYKVKLERARVEQQIQIYAARNALLREQIEYLSTDEYVEKAAREQLGYVKPGEVPYITRLKTDAVESGSE